MQSDLPVASSKTLNIVRGLIHNCQSFALVKVSSIKLKQLNATVETNFKIIRVNKTL